MKTTLAIATSFGILMAGSVSASLNEPLSIEKSPAQATSNTLLFAETAGQDNREDRRDDRDDRSDDRQDCRQAEGAGDDKRDCKQDARQDRNSDG